MGKMTIRVDCDNWYTHIYIYTYIVIPKATTEKAIQRDTLKT